MAPKKSTTQTTQSVQSEVQVQASQPVVAEKPKKVSKKVVEQPAVETPAHEQSTETPVVSEKPKKVPKKKVAEQPAVETPAHEQSTETPVVVEKPKRASKKKVAEQPAAEGTEQSTETPVVAEKPKRASKKKVTEQPADEGTEQSSSETVETSVETQPSSEKRVRKVVNQETLRSDVEQLRQHVDDEIQRLRTSDQKNKGVKFLKVVNKSLKTLFADLNRVLKTKTKVVRNKNTSSGFMKPVRISSEMALFTSWDQTQLYSRVDVTKFLCDYIRDNNLQNPEDRRQILCDDKLSSLLKFDKQSSSPLTYPGLQQHIQQHFLQEEQSVSEENVQP
jgi:upstream activation factor subunit UAF30